MNFDWVEVNEWDGHVRLCIWEGGDRTRSILLEPSPYYPAETFEWIEVDCGKEV